MQKHGLWANVTFIHQVGQNKEIVDNHKSTTDDDMEHLQNEVRSLLRSKIKVSFDVDRM